MLKDTLIVSIKQSKPATMIAERIILVLPEETLLLFLRLAQN